MSPSFPASDPTWNLEPIFEGGVESRAFAREVETLEDEAAELLDEVRKLEMTGDPSDELLEDWRAFFDRYFELGDRLSEAGSFARALSSANTDDSRAVRLPSRLDDVQTTRREIRVELQEAFDAPGDEEFEAVLEDERFSEMQLWLQELRRDARRAMDKGREELAVQLNRDGLHAWGRLYSEVSGRLEVEVERDQTTETCSVGQAKNLMTKADRDLRQSAFEGLQQAWGEAAPVCASALHSIRGTQQTLYRQRGGDCLTMPLEANRVERETVEAMFEAAREFRPLLVRYLKTKARALGVDGLEWYDLPAPVGDQRDEISYQEAQQFIVDQIDRFSPEIASFCRRALARRWVEAEDRAGKRQGGYCTTFPVSGEIRIFMTFGGTSSGVSTLAHELGHGYHNELMTDLPASQRRVPMGLAETASTLLEALVEQASLREASGAEELALLDGRMRQASAFLINIPARFELEKRMHQLRADGRLHEDVLCETTREVFEEAYGEAVESVDELFWASKLHYFMTRLPFYNFPYTFGYLFSRAVYRRTREDAGFVDRLEDLLCDTGRMRCEQLADKYLDADLNDPSFWRRAAGRLEEDVERYEQLVDEYAES